ncbi:MAG: TlyA family RNA methyltransferase [Eubacteriaceae bacterium]|jgi:23S rRNA (cytidine1920-2'-O)/16S rRNA (cytidine1409-2'-O)-methyltransferase|nr:TlyA family RNA methyltransferase [Eubacteriaceae bacterium]
MGKNRLDKELVLRGLAESRERASSLVMAGEVYVNGKMEDKAGKGVVPIDSIEICSRSPKYASRGGLKLEKALQAFRIGLSGKTALDVGASTGGFTDCMLKAGAKKVYAVDVGYGQLALSLRSDSRVVCLERENFRYLAFEKVGEPCDAAAMDVSFISAGKLAENLKRFLKEGADAIVLVKPQFESDRKGAGKKGVVRDRGKHFEAIEKVAGAFTKEGFFIWGIDYSPIAGPKGNIEFLAHFCLGKEGAEPAQGWESEMRLCVEKAHEDLG